MAAAIGKSLAAADPENAEAHAANLAALNDRIDALDKEIAETVAPVKDKPFIVFHDAYQNFDRHYGVRVAGTITVRPQVMPGAERVSAIQATVQERGATSVDPEPQLAPKQYQFVTKGN